MVPCCLENREAVTFHVLRTNLFLKILNKGGVAARILNLSNRRWVLSFTSRATYTWAKNPPVPIGQETGHWRKHKKILLPPRIELWFLGSTGCKVVTMQIKLTCMVKPSTELRHAFYYFKFRKIIVSKEVTVLLFLVISRWLILLNYEYLRKRAIF